MLETVKLKLTKPPVRHVIVLILLLPLVFATKLKLVVPLTSPLKTTNAAHVNLTMPFLTVHVENVKVLVPLVPKPMMQRHVPPVLKINF